MGPAAQRCNEFWHSWLAGTCIKVGGFFPMFQALGFPWLAPSGNRATSSNDLQKAQSLLGLGTGRSPTSKTQSGAGSRRDLETLSMISWIWAEQRVHRRARKHLVLSLNHLADIVRSPAVDPEGWHHISAEGLVSDAAGCRRLPVPYTWDGMSSCSHRAASVIPGYH